MRSEKCDFIVLELLFKRNFNNILVLLREIYLERVTSKKHNKMIQKTADHVNKFKHLYFEELIQSIRFFRITQNDSLYFYQ